MYNNIIKEEIVNNYLNNNSVRVIADKFDVCTRTISKILKEKGIPSKNRHERNRKYICDSHIFDKIDTAAKAYWIGQFLSDGFVTKDNYVGINLTQKDVEHIHKLRRFLCSNADVKMINVSKTSFTKNKIFRITICNIELGKALRNYGIVPHAKDTSPSNKLNDELKAHVIRGLVDGDGTITYATKVCTTKKDYKEFCVSLTGTLNIIHFLDEFIVHNKIAKKRTIFKCKRVENSYYINLQGNNQIKYFLDLIYKNADKTCYLDRKHAKYLELCDFLKESRKKE